VLHWNPLVPELLVADIDRSLAFWTGLIGFTVRFARPEDGFAYLDRDGAQVMLEQYDPSQRQWLIPKPIEYDRLEKASGGWGRRPQTPFCRLDSMQDVLI
jgi:catechol 2,3-dioxygenase-like lactoylglutathione lyase family enzyme